MFDAKAEPGWLRVVNASFSGHLQNDIAGDIIQIINTATKLLNAMRQNPNDWAMAKLLTVAKQHGLEIRSTGGSHHVFSHPSVKDPLSVPAHAAYQGHLYQALCRADRPDPGVSHDH